MVPRIARGWTIVLAVTGGSGWWAGGAHASPAEPPLIIATTSIWSDIVEQLDCGNELDVQVLIPPGGDPHSYEPSMQDRDRLDDAALIVLNGAGLEAALADTIDAATDAGAARFAVAEHVPVDELDPSTGDDEGTGDLDEHDGEEHDGDEHDGDEHDGEEHAQEEHAEDGAFDPHVWFDPTLVSGAVPALADALVRAGADEGVIAGCADRLRSSLDQLDADIAALVETLAPERRVLVTNHDALGYFARRYGFEILGSVLPSTSTLVEASPSELDALGEQILAAGVTAVFAEELEAADEASALADRLGVPVVRLYTDSLGQPGSGAETYQELLLHDATTIVEALADQ